MYNFGLKADAKNYLNAFGKLKFQNELYELRKKLPSEWYGKLDEIEQVILHSERSQVSKTHIKYTNKYILEYI